MYYQSNGQLLPVRKEWLPVVQMTWDGATRASHGIGKNLVAQSLTLSSGASKLFPDVVRSESKCLFELTNRIQLHLDEISKAKKSHLRAVDRYKKALNDAEASIKVKLSASSSAIDLSGNVSVAPKVRTPR